MRKDSCFFLIVLLLWILLTGCAGRLAAGRGYLTEGDRLASQGRWEEALIRYAQARVKWPDDIEVEVKYRKAKLEVARFYFERGKRHLEEGTYDKALLEFEKAVILDPGFDQARQYLKETKRRKESIYYFGTALKLLKAGKVREAKNALKRSIALNPENVLAREELRKLKSQEKMRYRGHRLEIASEKPITLEFRNIKLGELFEILSKVYGINFVFDKDVRRDKRTSIFLRDASFKDALDLILLTNSLAPKVVNKNTIIVYPDTPKEHKEYRELIIRTFFLSNAEAKKVLNLIRTILKLKDAYVNEELNAIVVRGTPEVIDLAERIIEANDIPDAEVMLEVEVLEINRNKALKLGIDLSPDSITAEIPTTDGTISLRDLKGLSSGDVLLTLPAAILDIKKEDLDANILANPRIRVKNREKAKIHIGERIPIITTSVNQGVTTETVQYQDVGLKLTVEPYVHLDNEIELKIGLEVSSLGTKTVTSTGSVVFQFGTRNAESVLRLHDGETQIIGGLINDEERTTTVKVPFLGEVPVLGRLFSSKDTSNVKTDILLSITPHIVRGVVIPDEEVREFWSGRGHSFSTEPLFEEGREEVREDTKEDGGKESKE